MAVVQKGKAKVNWAYKPGKHKTYTDLGKYVIDFGKIDQEGLERGRLAVNSRVDFVSGPACTGIVKLNSKGEVIMGRNQDLELSNYPAFISHFVGGKYQCIAFYYNNIGQIRYDAFQKGVKLPEGFREMQSVASSDAFNEKGLYIQCDMRTARGHFTTGTNPSGLRVCMGTLAVFVAQNAATVKEALEYLKTLDIYSPGATKDGQARAGWDGGYMIGDATGEYGVIEFSSNKMYYTPYANGHANYYVSPVLVGCNRYCCGYGRLEMAQQSMIGAETEKDMLEAVHKADWRRIIEDIAYSHRDENGNPVFMDKDGNPSVDYRMELPELFCVDDEGHYLPTNLAAQNEFISNNGLQELFAHIGYVAAELFTTGEKKKEEVASEYEAYLADLSLKTFMRYHDNCTLGWLTDPDHFEEVKQAMMDFFTQNNAFELLEKFHAGDDKPIRDKGDIFTTGMNFGINCAKKHLMVRFFEDEEAIYEYQW